MGLQTFVFPFSYCLVNAYGNRFTTWNWNNKGIDKFYSLHLLKEEEMDLPTVRNNLDVELQMQLNAQQVEASSCPGSRKSNIIKAWL